MNPYDTQRQAAAQQQYALMNMQAQVREFTISGNYAQQFRGLNQSGQYSQLMGLAGAANAYGGSYYGLQNAYRPGEYRRMDESGRIMPQEPLPPAPRMRVCQNCGFTREAYADTTNVSPETCGNCS